MQLLCLVRTTGTSTRRRSRFVFNGIVCSVCELQYILFRFGRFFLLLVQWLQEKRIFELDEETEDLVVEDKVVRQKGKSLQTSKVGCLDRLMLPFQFFSSFTHPFLPSSCTGQRFAFLLVTSGRVTEELEEIELPWNCALVTAEDFDAFFGVTIGAIMRHMFAGMYEDDLFVGNPPHMNAFSCMRMH